MHKRRGPANQNRPILLHMSRSDRSPWCPRRMSINRCPCGQNISQTFHVRSPTSATCQVIEQIKVRCRGVYWKHIFGAANQVDPKDSATLKGAAEVFLRRDLGDHNDLKLPIGSTGLERRFWARSLNAAELSRNKVEVRSIRRRRPVKPKCKGGGL